MSTAHTVWNREMQEIPCIKLKYQGEYEINQTFTIFPSWLLAHTVTKMSLTSKDTSVPLSENKV